MLTALVIFAIIEFVAIIMLANELYKLHNVASQKEVSIPLTAVAVPVMAKCQFCGETLRKIIRSKEGWYCCEKCSVLVLNQIPNQDRVKELLAGMK